MVLQDLPRLRLSFGILTNAGAILNSILVKTQYLVIFITYMTVGF